MKFLRGGRGAGTAPREHETERPEDERPPAHLMALYGFQHVLALYAGVIAPPLVMATAVGLDTTETALILSAALLVSGLATLLQTLGVWRFGARVPMVIGASFTPVTAMTAIADQSGLPAVFGASMVAGLFGLLVAPFVSTLLRFFPPVVTGSVITVIGITLIPVAVGWITDEDPSGVPTGTGLGLAAATLAITLVLTKVLPGVWNRASILLGLVLGTLLAVPFGRVDFSTVGEGPVVSFAEPFHFGLPEFPVAAVMTMCIVMIAIMAEGVADILAMSKVVGTEVDSRRMADGLRADASTALVGPLLNSFPGSTFSQNIGLIALNKVKSRYVVAVSGLFLILMSLFPALSQIVAMVPSPVLGGAGLVLFGSVAAAGVQTLGQVDYEGNHNMIVVAVSLGLGIISIVSPAFFEVLPEGIAMLLASGIVTATASALVLNVFFNVLGGSKRPDAEGAGQKSGPAPSTRD